MWLRWITKRNLAVLVLLLVGGSSLLSAVTASASLLGIGFTDYLLSSEGMVLAAMHPVVAWLTISLLAVSGAAYLAAAYGIFGKKWWTAWSFIVIGLIMLASLLLTLVVSRVVSSLELLIGVGYWYALWHVHKKAIKRFFLQKLRRTWLHVIQLAPKRSKSR